MDARDEKERARRAAVRQAMDEFLSKAGWKLDHVGLSVEPTVVAGVVAYRFVRTDGHKAEWRVRLDQLLMHEPVRFDVGGVEVDMMLLLHMLAFVKAENKRTPLAAE